MAGHLTDSQVGQLREMPPPPQRRRNKQQMSEDSQLGRCVDYSELASERGDRDKESSAVSGALPAGFFEAPLAKKAKNETEFDTFMQEISAMGSVKNNKDGTIVEVEEEEHRRPRHRNDQEYGGERGQMVHDDSVQGSQEDYADDFEQFVRRERMKEVREAARNKTRPNDQESHQEMMGQISAMGSNNAVRLRDISLPGRQSIADSYNLAMQAASDSNSSESSEEDWRAKKL